MPPSEEVEPAGENRLVRAIGALMVPFVAGAELLGIGVMRFFGFFEKLNPLAFVQRLLAPLQPLVVRVQAFLRTVFDPLWKALDRIVRAVFGWARPLWTVLTSISRRAGEWAQQQWTRLLQATASARAAIVRFAGRVRVLWHRALAPVRRARASASAFVARIRSSIRTR